MPSFSDRLNLFFTFLFGALLIYVALLMLPNYVGVMVPSLDSSWGFALNYFIHSHLTFGPDLVITYGPLGFLVTPSHIGNNLQIALAIRLAVWAVTFWQIVGLWRAGNRFGAVAFLIAMGLSYRFYYFYWENLVTALVLILYVRVLRETGRDAEMLLIAILTGMLFLVKFTTYLLAMLMLASYTLRMALYWRQSTRKHLLLVGLIWASGPIAYLMYSPSLFNLYLYVKGFQSLSFGFAEAMSADADPSSMSRALILCALLVAGAAAAVLSRAAEWTAAPIVFAGAWAMFRYGFTRGDVNHEASFFYFAPLLVAALIAFTRFTPVRLAFGICFFALFLGISVPAAGRNWNMYPSWKPSVNLYGEIPFWRWGEAMHALDQASTDAVAKSPIGQYRARLDRSRVMIFPQNLAYAAQSSFDLFPLYAVQNYEAYTHYLDQQGAAHLTAANPPVRYVVFEWEAIDGRNPLVDTPNFSTALLAQYAPVEIHPESALLERRPVPLNITETAVGRADYHREAWVQVPARDTPVAVSIELSKIWEAKLIEAAYKLPAVYLEARLASGAVNQFRVPPDVLSSPFLVNPLPVNLQEAMDLWQGKRAKDPVVQLRLTGPGLCDFRAKSWNFFDVHGLTASPAPPPPPASAPNIPDPPQRADLNGYIERLNGADVSSSTTDPAHPATLKRGSSATLEGWLVFGDPSTNGVPLDEVFAIVSTKDGSPKTLPGSIIARPDVRDHFGNPRILQLGFHVEIPADLFAAGLVRIDIMGRIHGNSQVHRYGKPLFLQAR